MTTPATGFFDSHGGLWWALRSPEEYAHPGPLEPFGPTGLARAATPWEIRTEGLESSEETPLGAARRLGRVIEANEGHEWPELVCEADGYVCDQCGTWHL